MGKEKKKSQKRGEEIVKLPLRKAFTACKGDGRQNPWLYY